MIAAQLLDIDILLLIYAVIAFLFVGVGLTAMILFVKAKYIRAEACHIMINENEELTKTVVSGSTLLSTLSSQGIAVPSPCGGKATCLQCRVQIVEGADPPLETDLATFSRKEIKDGWRLSCQAKVKHDMHIHLEESSLDVKEFEGTIISNDNVATFIKEIVE